jgi:phosphate starvation-inducible PhoH-like protein
MSHSNPSNRKVKTPKSAQDMTQEPTKDRSPRVSQREKINFTLNLRGLDWTEKQKAFIELATSKQAKIIFLSGPAGTSKSILAVFCALQMLNEKKVSDIIYVRTIIESATTSMGTLPGDENDKLKFFVAVLNDKLEELLSTADIKKLYADERIKGMPVNYLRGASYNAKAVIVDEAQNGTFGELLTCLTRIGKFSKYFILGDPMQTDLKHKDQSGFKPMFDIFNTDKAQDEGIYCVEFGKEDIMRSEILKFIIEQVEIYKNQNSSK